MKSKQIDIIKDVFVPENTAECDRLLCDNCYYGYERRECPEFSDEAGSVKHIIQPTAGYVEPITPWSRK